MINIRKIENKQESQFNNNNKSIKKLCPDGCKSIVDTGTYLVYGPNDEILELLSGTQLNSCADKPNLPDFAFEF